ncbi:hypothetical protein [Nocardia sp. NPDC051570]|uniref:hypothetical protein n=1 Tax=Nocardia sp. NPDC051570 TaxID=3364324 RepID=UPI00378B4B39
MKSFLGTFYRDRYLPGRRSNAPCIEPRLTGTRHRTHGSPGARESWAERFADCDRTPVFLSLEQARFVLTSHSGHGPYCLPYLAALAVGSSVID